MLKIGDFSRLGQVTIKALHHYDRIGLLRPEYVDPLTGYRYYAANQFNRLDHILMLKEIDLSLEQIADILSGELATDEIRGMLKLKRAELKMHIDDKEAQLRRVETRLRQLDMEAMMTDKITIKEVPAQHMLAYRSIIPDTSYISKMFGDAHRAALSADIPVGDAPWLALYYHEEFTEKDLDFELAIPVASDFEGTLDLGDGQVMTVCDMPAQTLACITIRYREQEDVRAGNLALARWIDENDYTIAALPCRESYAEDPAPDGTLTFETQFPIHPK